MAAVVSAVVSTVGNLIGGKMSSDAAKDAANIQATASNNASAANTAALERQIELSQPWRKAGETAVNQLSALTQPGGRATQDFSYGPFNYSADPGYAFRLKEGMNAMNATAAARGGLISGNALKAGQTYGQEMGSQEYQNSFNRYLQNYSNAQNTFQMNRNNLLSPLQFLSAQGQGAAAGQAANIGNTAAANSALSTGAANTNAAGQIGSANAWTNAIGSGINQYNMNNMMSRFAGGQNTSAYTSNAGYGLNAADNWLTRQSNQASPDFTGPSY